MLCITNMIYSMLCITHMNVFKVRHITYEGNQWYYSVRSEQYHWLLTTFNETHNMLWLPHSESILTSQKLSGISKSKYQLMYLKLLRSSETNNYINHDFIRHKWWSLLRRNVVVCIVDIGEKFTNSDDPFGIFKLFLPSLCKLSLHNLFSEFFRISI